MNVFGRASHRWRKNRKRGVSPIIATILLVAITVVLAGVLYILISGLTHTGASTPYYLSMTLQSPPGEEQSGTSWYEPLALDPTTGMTTSMVAFTMLYQGSPAGAPGVVAASGTCTFGAAFAAGTNCLGVAGGWYGVLVSSGTVYATYSLISGVPAWSNLGSGVSSSPITPTITLWILSQVNYNAASGSYTLSVGGAGGSSVSGSATL